MRVVLQPAFVLHRRSYGDTSQLIEIFTRDHGRAGLVAKGVRVPRSRVRGLLQPFTLVLLSWIGRGELPQLLAVEEAGVPILLPTARLFSGLYVNELLLRLLQRHDPYPGLFESYRTVLESLASVPAEEPVLRVFEKRLLAELGYGLRLDTEAVNGKPIVPTSTYRYVLDQGPVETEPTAEGILISGKGLLALHQEAFNDTTLWREIKRLTRAALSVHLQGRPLKTREMLLARRQRQPG